MGGPTSAVLAEAYIQNMNQTDIQNMNLKHQISGFLTKVLSDNQ
jgi:hypothetical protein